MLRTNDSVYYVGELIRDIIVYIEEGSNPNQISKILSSRDDPKFHLTKDDVINVVENYIKPLGLKSSLAPQQNSVLRDRLGGGDFLGRWKLISFKQMRWMLTFLQHLFHPVLFVVLFLGAIGLNAYLLPGLWTTEDVSSGAGDCFRNIAFLAVYYPIALLILFFHELGHAASSYLFRATPKSIGFGFYLIFPVLYTDVTEIWKIARYKRVIVNLGGIYFQLLINILLIVWYHSTSDDLLPLIRSTIVINSVTIFLNLNPFFKFDGYWIYSDIFNLKNLHSQTFAYLIYTIKKNHKNFFISIPSNTLKVFRPHSPALMIYTILYYSFWGLVCYSVFHLTVNAFAVWRDMINNIRVGDFSICSLESYLGTILMTLVFVGIFIKRSKTYAAYSRQYIKNLRLRNGSNQNQLSQ